METIYTDLIPAGASMKYKGKIFVGTGDQKTIEKPKEKESA